MIEKHTIQYNTIQYNTIQYNTIQYNTIQYNTMVQILIRNVSFTATKVQLDIGEIKICRPRRVNVGTEECTVFVDLNTHAVAAEMLVNALNGQVLPGGLSGRAVDSRFATTSPATSSAALMIC